MRTLCIAAWVVAIALVVTLCALPARAGISISPAYVEVSLDDRAPTGRFVINNVGDTEERYRVRAVNFIFLENGGLVRIEGNEHSMAQWLKFHPKEFTLGPKMNQAVRFAVVPRGKLADGEYWGAIELESLNTKTGSGQDAAGRTFNLEVVPTILVPVFGRKGDVKAEAEVTDVALKPTAKGDTLFFTLDNEGTGRLLADAAYTVSDSSGQTVADGTLKRCYVLRNSRRQYKVKLEKPLTSGTYTVTARVTAPQLSEPVSAETKVEYSAPAGQPAPQQPQATAVSEGDAKTSQNDERGGPDDAQPAAASAEIAD